MIATRKDWTEISTKKTAKPCQVCGSDEILIHESGNGAYIECGKCHMSMSGIYCDFETALKNWNRPKLRRNWRIMRWLKSLSRAWT